MKVLILNGPPGCGKDTIANLLCEVAPVIRGEFKAVLYEETANLLSEIAEDLSTDMDVREITWQEVSRRNNNRDLKEEPWVGGLSVRRWLQITSEMVVKKDKGSDFFGVAAADYWHGKYIHHVISDGGFIDEVNAVVDKFGPTNVYVIRLHRHSFGFGTDTRNYIVNSNAVELDFHLEEDNPIPAVQFLQELLSE